MPIAKQIIDEQSTHYLVDWKDDIITGTKYHSSWVIKLAISLKMIQAWEQVKAANRAAEQDHLVQQTDLGLMNFNGQSFSYQPHVCHQLLLDSLGTMTYHWGPVHLTNFIEVTSTSVTAAKKLIFTEECTLMRVQMLSGLRPRRRYAMCAQRARSTSTVERCEPANAALHNLITNVG